MTATAAVSAAVVVAAWLARDLAGISIPEQLVVPAGVIATAVVAAFTDSVKVAAGTLAGAVGAAAVIAFESLGAVATSAELAALNGLIMFAVGWAARANPNDGVVHE